MEDDAIRRAEDHRGRAPRRARSSASRRRGPPPVPGLGELRELVRIGQPAVHRLPGEGGGPHAVGPQVAPPRALIRCREAPHRGRRRPPARVGPKRRDGAIEVRPGPAMILEGVGAARRELAPYLAYTIWIDADRQLAMDRGMAWHGTARPCGSGGNGRRPKSATSTRTAVGARRPHRVERCGGCATRRHVWRRHRSDGDVHARRATQVADGLTAQPGRRLTLHVPAPAQPKKLFSRRPGHGAGTSRMNRSRGAIREISHVGILLIGPVSPRWLA